MVRSFQEAFQTSQPGSTAATDISRCPEGAIASFPLGLSFTMTDMRYEEVSDPLSIEFKWGSRATAPRFLSGINNSEIDEVGAGVSNLSTLIHQQVNYSLEYVQICSATHSRWLLPLESQEKNKEDVLVVFSTSSSNTAYKYLMFIVPILRSDETVTDPKYLRGLASPALSGPFTLRDLFPTNPTSLFAYYSSCLRGVTTQSPPENVYIFVSTEGIRASAALMQRVMKTISDSITSFPAPNPPFMTRFERGEQRTLGSNFRQFVLSTNQLLNAEGKSRILRSAAKEIREDTLDAYKCIPLNPEADIEDGKLKFDVESGQLLSKVVEERSTVQSLDNSRITQMNTEFIEKSIGISIAVVLGILVLGIIIYLARTALAPSVLLASGAVAAAATPPEPWTKRITTYAVTVVLVGIAGLGGFIFGAIMS